jgi:cytochrome P450
MAVERPDVSSECVIDLDHHSVEFNLNELEISASLRRRCPVAWNTRYDGFWFATSYAAVSQIARDNDTFAHKYEPNARDGINYYGELGIPRPPGLRPLGVGEVDGPYHHALRRALNPFLAPQRVARLRPFMEACATWFIDQKISVGEMDLVLDLASPVPAVLTMRMLGLPVDDWARWADFFHSTIAYPPGSDEYMHAMAAGPEMASNLKAFAAERRAHPRDDLTSFLVHAEVGGEPLNDQQVLDILLNLVGGGVDTTTSLTAWTLYLLGSHPELRQQLIDRPELYVTAVDEFLRYTSVNQTLSRTVTKDVVVEEHTMRRNDRVLMSWLAANHDENEFERPDELVIDRSPNRHLAFGLGPHRCIGSHLAKAMFEVMLRAVLDRIADYEIDVDKVEPYLGDPAMTGIVKLPASFTPAAGLGTPRPW